MGEMRIKTPKTLWEDQVKNAKEMLEKEALTEEDKKYISNLLDTSNQNMVEFESNTYKMIGLKQSIEVMLRIFTPFRNATPEFKKLSYKKQIKKTDPTLLWNAWVGTNGMLNLMIDQIGMTKERYDIYGEEYEEIK